MWEASRAGPGGCSCCYDAVAESGGQHDCDGDAQAEAEEKPAVSSPAVPELAGAELTHRRTVGGA